MFTKDQLAPLPDVYEGVFVLRADKLGKRFQLPKFQLVQILGGFGCEPGNLGSKVSVRFLADDESCFYRRGDFLGVPSQQQIDEALADPREEAPLDPTDMVYLAAGQGAWGKAATLEEAKEKCNVAGGEPSVAFYCHAETQVTDWGSIQWPRGMPEPQQVWEANK